MKILFMSTLSYRPQYYCGANTSTDQLCHGLMQKGHHVSVLAALRPDGRFTFMPRLKGRINWKLYGCKVSRDIVCGYPVWRSWLPWEAVGFVANKEKPDVIVVVAGEIVRLALAVKKTGVPLLMKLTDVEFHRHGGDFKELGLVPCVANSHFTANVYRKKFGVNTRVIYPIVRPDKYKTQSTRENVTFINPHPEKGPQIALAIARQCPDIPFAFYKTSILNEQQLAALNNQIAQLPNVTLYKAQDDMKNVYGKCKILLAPSVWEETYGRVATEAQMSGIPTVASTRGGLPEAVGSGGVVIDPDAPIDQWVAAVRKLWDDERYYAEMSAAALANVQRPEVNPERQLEAQIDALKAASGIAQPEFKSA